MTADADKRSERPSGRGQASGLFGVANLVRTTPMTVSAAKVLGNGVEFAATLFGPRDGLYVCTVSICLPRCDSADPQYATLGTFKSKEAALCVVNDIAAEASREDPSVIFGVPGHVSE